MKIKLPKKFATVTALLVSLIAIASVIAVYLYLQNTSLSHLVSSLRNTISSVEQERDQTSHELDDLRNQDQVKRNDELEERIKNIEDTYDTAVIAYEELLKYKEAVNDTESFDILFTQSLTQLSDQNYTSASATLKELTEKIDAEQKKLAAAEAVAPPANVPVNNAPPGSGFSRQTVSTDVGSFLVSIVAADLSTTRVIVDTASSSDCGNDCPVLSLGEYVSRNGAYAGINGTYFCPASYPSCAGKTNSFDLLVMNKDKYYFNSGNNVYSNNPAVIFGGGYVRFVSAASQWGRDTGVDGVISNFPLLVFNNNISFGGDDDPKKGSRAGRSFVANKGNTVYIGVVHNSTVAEAAHALKTLGMENGMNLDSGGSTALWSGGYKAGPGRNIPNAILFVKK